MPSVSKYLPDTSPLYLLFSSTVFLLAFSGLRAGFDQPATTALITLTDWIGAPTGWTMSLGTWAGSHVPVLSVVAVGLLGLGLLGILVSDVERLLSSRSGATVALGAGLLLQVGTSHYVAAVLIVAVLVWRGWRNGFEGAGTALAAIVLGGIYLPVALASWVMGSPSRGAVHKVRVVGGHLDTTAHESP